MQQPQDQTIRRYSISGQLLFWLMICLFIILSISSISSYSRIYHFANLAYDRSLLRSALALADQADVVNDKVKIDLPQIAQDLLEYDKDDYISYRISAPDGTLVVGDVGIAPPRKKIVSDGHIYYDDILNGEKVRVVAYALPIINSKLTGNLLIQVAETLDKRELMVSEIIKEMLIPQILIMLVTALVILFSVKHSLSPLNRLKNALSNRSHNDLSPLSTNDTPSEIKPLLNEINALMRRVDEGINFQKAFIADASHQLRTPLAALQNQAELALREKLAPNIQHSLENIAVSTSHLSHMVHQLLTLARVEPSTKSNYTFSLINLSNLAREITTEWVPKALSKNIDLGFDTSTETVIISGNPFMLKEMLSNLIDNAICYTPQGGEITVSIVHKNNLAILQVIDNGIGIAPDKREQVFNRFYRIHDNLDEGCGLGLAIVKEVAHAHGASLYISDNNVQANAEQLPGCIFNVEFETSNSVTLA